MAAEVLVEYDYSAGGLMDSSHRYVSRVRARSGVLANFRLSLVGGVWRIAVIETIRQGHPA